MSYQIPFNKPFIVGQELYYIAQCVLSGHTAGDGEYARRCQDLMKRRFDVPHILLTTSCTTALDTAAILSGVEPGDEVVVPSYTFVSTANSFLARGAKIRFVDIRPDTLNMDESKLEEVVSESTRVIVPVHYAGVGCEMDSICALARANDAMVIEDAAQGVNARYKGRFLGTIGDIGTYSFHETKNYICGEGGALVTRSDEYAGRAEIIREKGTNRKQFFRGEVDKYTWVDLGSSYVISDILAAFLYAQLERMDEILERRKALYWAYHRNLRPLEERGVLRLPAIPEHCETNYHMFYVLLNERDARPRLIEHLKNKGILSVFHYVPLHTSPMGQRLGYGEGMLPVTEDLAARLLRLPMYYELTMPEIERVTSEVFAFFGAAGGEP